MKKIFTLILFIAVFLFKPFYSHAQAANVNDSLALVDLYNSTDGPNWINNSGWLKGPVNTWYGISLNTFGRVIQIKFFYNGLSGSIPTTLGNLTQLQNLLLVQNQLSDSIPSSLGNLDSLINLNLSKNYKLTGGIPTSLNNLTNLQILDLHECALTGNIPQFSSLLKLQYLTLSTNQLTGIIPASLGKLTNLQGLYLNDNQLTGSIPASLGNLNNLYFLYIEDNQLTSNIPSSLGNLGTLIRFLLSNNQLSGEIPTSFTNLANLSNLDLSYNKLSGNGPALLTNISNVLPTAVVIAFNDFTFDGMEAFATKFNDNSYDDYSGQALLPLHYASNKLSVSAGGTLTNNTYKWYKGDTLVATVSADSNYKPTSAGNYWVAVTNSIATKLTLYSDTIAVTNAELPITYLNFTAQQTHNGNLLQWQTATEINSAYFNVQRSTDGIRFTNIAQVNAAGNSSTIQSYQYTDALTGLTPVPPAFFYRLQEADKDGDVTYSKIIKLDNNSAPQVSLSIFPNPVHEVLNVQLQGITGAATILVTDAGGKTLQAQEVNAANGQTISINTQTLAAGVYFVQVLHDKQSVTQKFVKE